VVLGGLVLVGAALFGLLACVGARLPKDHVASRRVLIHRPATEVFAVMRDFAHAAEWRTDVERVEMLVQPGDRIRFQEKSRHGVITFELAEEVPGERLVTRIADDQLPFGGTWTYELRTKGDATQVAITERGFVKPAVFRALARYVFGYDRTLEQYLRALGRRFGEDITPEAAEITT
jgi:Polyketide cyclase / dehydrase and lipid transport